MIALRCDICGKFFDPIEDGNKYKKAGECVTNKITFLESLNGRHKIIKEIDVCHECSSKMLDSVDFRIPIDNKEE